MRDSWRSGGGPAVALAPDRRSPRSWSSGSRGETAVGGRLAAIAGEAIRVLHDRRIPGTRANIDHLVVTAAGVWVVDATRCSGRPELRAEGGFFRPRVESLAVGGQDRTGLVEGVLRQVDCVRGAVAGIPVVGAVCFVEADWPLLGGDFRVRGVEVLWPGRLVERLRAERGEVGVGDVAASLARHFLAA